MDSWMMGGRGEGVHSGPDSGMMGGRGEVVDNVIMKIWKRLVSLWWN